MVGGLDQYVADEKNLSGLPPKKIERRLTVMDERPG